MPDLSVTRRDFQIVVAGRREIEITLIWDGTQISRAMSSVDVLLALAGTPASDPAAALFAALDLSARFKAFCRALPHHLLPVEFSGG